MGCGDILQQHMPLIGNPCALSAEPEILIQETKQQTATSSALILGAARLATSRPSVSTAMV